MDKNGTPARSVAKVNEMPDSVITEAMVRECVARSKAYLEKTLFEMKVPEKKYELFLKNATPDALLALAQEKANGGFTNTTFDYLFLAAKKSDFQITPCTVMQHEPYNNIMTTAYKESFERDQAAAAQGAKIGSPDDVRFYTQLMKNSAEELKWDASKNITHTKNITHINSNLEQTISQHLEKYGLLLDFFSQFPSTTEGNEWLLFCEHLKRGSKVLLYASAVADSKYSSYPELVSKSNPDKVKKINVLVGSLNRAGGKCAELLKHIGLLEFRGETKNLKEMKINIAQLLNEIKTYTDQILNYHASLIAQ